MIAQFSGVFGEKHVNIENFINASRGDYAYSMIDVNEFTSEIVSALNEIDGVIKVRVI